MCILLRELSKILRVRPKSKIKANLRDHNLSMELGGVKRISVSDLSELSFRMSN